MKTITLLIAAALFAVMLSGCGDGGAASSAAPAGDTKSAGKVDDPKPGAAGGVQPGPEPMKPPG